MCSFLTKRDWCNLHLAQWLQIALTKATTKTKIMVVSMGSIEAGAVAIVNFGLTIGDAILITSIASGLSIVTITLAIIFLKDKVTKLQGLLLHPVKSVPELFSRRLFRSRQFKNHFGIFFSNTFPEGLRSLIGIASNQTLLVFCSSFSPYSNLCIKPISMRVALNFRLLARLPSGTAGRLTEGILCRTFAIQSNSKALRMVGLE